MNVAQRGTSSTSTGYQTVDRWKMTTSNMDNVAFSQTQSTVAPSGFGQSWRIDCTTVETALASDEIAYFFTSIEGQDLQKLQNGSSGAKSLTLSFHVKSNETGTRSVNLYKPDNTVRQISATYTINSADTWEFKSISFPGDTGGGGIDDDTGGGLFVYFMLAAGSDFTSSDSTSWGNYANAGFAYGHAVNLFDNTANDWAVTGVQLEVGDVATAFEHRSFGDELHRCQRYFEVIVSGNSKEIGGGNYYSSSSIHCPIIFETSKRTNSYAVTVTGGTNYFRVYRNSTNDDFDNFGGSTRLNINRCLLYANSGVSGTAGHGLELLTNNASAKIVVDDEI